MNRFVKTIVAEVYTCCVQKPEQCFEHVVIVGRLGPAELAEWRLLNFAGTIYPYCPKHREAYEKDAAWAAEKEKQWNR